MSLISIPKPCHEDWNAMTPREGGRHCLSCAKTVVDFTGMSAEEVQRYLLDRLPGQVCGRFHMAQVQRVRIELSPDIFDMYMPWWKRFLAASLLAFSMMLFSCDSNVMGKAVAPGTDSLVTLPQGKNNGEHLMGDTVIQDKAVCVQPTAHEDTAAAMILGMIAPHIVTDREKEAVKAVQSRIH